MIETLEYTTVDKTPWKRGPWDSEVDKKQWQDPETGLPCLIVRGPLGAWCGYVGVSSEHPLYEKSEVDLEVHGGVTYTDHCSPGPEKNSICHVAPEGEDNVWWIGFDCAHYRDLVPGMIYGDLELRRMLDAESIYRDQSYVESEVQNAAKQLKSIAENNDD